MRHSYPRVYGLPGQLAGMRMNRGMQLARKMMLGNTLWGRGGNEEWV